MPMIQTRRQFLTTLSLTGAAGLVGAPRALAAEGAVETTTVRLAKGPGICIAPQYVAEELLRAEGFTDIRYVDGPPGATEPVAHRQGRFRYELCVELRQGHRRRRADHAGGRRDGRLLRIVRSESVANLTLGARSSPSRKSRQFTSTAAATTYTGGGRRSGRCGGSGHNRRYTARRSLCAAHGACSTARCGSRSAIAAPIRGRPPGSQSTRRWREMDSNHRSPVGTAFPAELAGLRVGAF
jgi:hypothetical protein